MKVHEVARWIAVSVLAVAAFGASAQSSLPASASESANGPKVLDASSDNVSGLWWNPAESGWGINFAQQDRLLFATMFIYESGQKPLWLVMSNGVRQPDDSTFTGELYRTTGPAFNAEPFTPLGASNVTRVGTLTVRFASGNSATLSYTVNGTTVTKSIQPQVFGTNATRCSPTASSRYALGNYQDLWWNPTESGWGVSIAHQNNTVFATLFTYAGNGTALWLVATGTRQSDGTFLGDLFRTTGTPFDVQPFVPLGAGNVTRVGTMRLRFENGELGFMTYSVDGVTVSKTIRRQTFSTPFAACASLGAVASVRIASPASSPIEGDFVPMQLTVADSSGNPLTGRRVTWTSTAPWVAKVNENGLVTTVGSGTVTLTAVVEGRSGAIDLVVTPRGSVPVGQVFFAFGPEETVHAWQTDRCEDTDFAEMPAHPIRAADGSIMLLAGQQPTQYAWRGANFNSLRRDCAPVFKSRNGLDASSYDNREWLASIYRVDDTIHGLVHVEWHDPFSNNCLRGDTSHDNPCWMNSIAYVSSTDGGRSFQRPSSPANVVAPAPRRWDAANPAADKPFGYFTPSNILRRGDGFYYALFFAIPDPANQAQRGDCVMRTANLGDPSSWRAWDGSGFNLPLANPYLSPGNTVTPCTIVLPYDLIGRVSYNSVLRKFIMVGAARTASGASSCGLHFTLSEDLVTWSTPVQIKQGFLPFTPCLPPDGTAGIEAYASFVDPEDSGVNFETTGNTGFIYVTRFNGGRSGMDRDVRRYPVTLIAR